MTSQSSDSGELKRPDTFHFFRHIVRSLYDLRYIWELHEFRMATKRWQE